MASSSRMSDHSVASCISGNTKILADREQRRDAMEADLEWQAYRRVALEEDTLVDMENQILKPVPFFVPC